MNNFILHHGKLYVAQFRVSTFKHTANHDRVNEVKGLKYRVLWFDNFIQFGVGFS